VIPTITDARLRFQTLVAAHVIGVVSRELAAGDAPYAALAAQRVALPGAPPDDATLCAHIDAGDFDADDSGVQLRAHLRARAEHALMAWNPFYLARVMNDDTP
jgi:hypothetical protein